MHLNFQVSKNVYKFSLLPVNVELVKILTIFELTGGKDLSDPEKIESITFSSIVKQFKKTQQELIFKFGTSIN